MFDNLRESWFVSKVETLIQVEINNLPLLLKAHTEGLAHAMVIHQYRTSAFPFEEHNGQRFNPYLAAFQSVLNFINSYNREGLIIINGEDCLGMLKIITLKFMKRVEEISLSPGEATFIDMFSGPLFRKIFPELCTE